VSRFLDWDPYGGIPYPLHTARSFSTPAYSLDIFFYIFCEIKSSEKVRPPGVLKGRLKPQPTASLLFPSQAGKRPHRAEFAPSNLQTHRKGMSHRENVDSRASDGFLWCVAGETFSITYSIVKIPQTRIMEPIHPLLNQNNACAHECKIISSVQRSKLRLHLAVLNEMGGGRS
jgi:hypothetical protein